MRFLIPLSFILVFSVDFVFGRELSRGKWNGKGSDWERGNHSSHSKISPDARCGGRKGYTCLHSGFGDCCSEYGWCGSTNKYCKTGCQPSFGLCAGGPSPSSPCPPGPSHKVSNNAKCGSNGNGATCLNSSFGDCCSRYGWCGSTSAYCGEGCDKEFGNCSGHQSSSSPTLKSSSRIHGHSSSKEVPSAGHKHSSSKAVPSAGHNHSSSKAISSSGHKHSSSKAVPSSGHNHSSTKIAPSSSHNHSSSKTLLSSGQNRSSSRTVSSSSHGLFPSKVTSSSIASPSTMSSSVTSSPALLSSSESIPSGQSSQTSSGIVSLSPVSNSSPSSIISAVSTSFASSLVSSTPSSSSASSTSEVLSSSSISVPSIISSSSFVSSPGSSTPSSSSASSTSEVLSSNSLSVPSIISSSSSPTSVSSGPSTISTSSSLSVSSIISSSSSPTSVSSGPSTISSSSSLNVPSIISSSSSLTSVSSGPSTISSSSSLTSVSSGPSAISSSSSLSVSSIVSSSTSLMSISSGPSTIPSTSFSSGSPVSSTMTISSSSATASPSCPAACPNGYFIDTDTISCPSTDRKCDLEGYEVVCGRIFSGYTEIDAGFIGGYKPCYTYCDNTPGCAGFSLGVLDYCSVYTGTGYLELDTGADSISFFRIGVVNLDGNYCIPTTTLNPVVSSTTSRSATASPSCPAACPNGYFIDTDTISCPSTDGKCDLEGYEVVCGHIFSGYTEIDAGFIGGYEPCYTYCDNTPGCVGFSLGVLDYCSVYTGTTGSLTLDLGADSISFFRIGIENLDGSYCIPTTTLNPVASATSTMSSATASPSCPAACSNGVFVDTDTISCPSTDLKCDLEGYEVVCGYIFSGYTEINAGFIGGYEPCYTYCDNTVGCIGFSLGVLDYCTVYTGTTGYLELDSGADSISFFRIGIENLDGNYCLPTSSPCPASCPNGVFVDTDTISCPSTNGKCDLEGYQVVCGYIFSGYTEVDAGFIGGYVPCYTYCDNTAGCIGFSLGVLDYCTVYTGTTGYLELDAGADSISFFRIGIENLDGNYCLPTSSPCPEACPNGVFVDTDTISCPSTDRKCDLEGYEVVCGYVFSSGYTEIDAGFIGGYVPCYTYCDNTSGCVGFSLGILDYCTVYTGTGTLTLAAGSDSITFFRIGVDNLDGNYCLPLA